MKTHPELYAWLILVISYLLMIALAAIIWNRKRISHYIGEWCFVLSEIFHGRGKRWNDEG